MGKSNHKIAIIGLGYVGLPLAVDLQKNNLLLDLHRAPNRSIK